MAEHDAVTETVPDADLQMKKRARRRLVGAAALALFAVIVLPMVMDHEPRPPVQDIQMRIPAQDAGGIAGRLLPKKAAITPLPAATPSAPSVLPAPAVVPAAANQSAVAEKKSTTEDAKPAQPAASDQKSAKESSAQWVIQLGTYKESGNAKHLLAKLKGIHLPAYTENLDTPQGPRVRVRAGPFASREAAEKARARVKIIGVDGPVAPK